MLSEKNVSVSHDEFMDAYMRATSVFNAIYGVMAMQANNAVTEAMDAYEGTREWRFDVKRSMKRCAKAWDERWAVVKELFQEKYAVYVDFASQQCKDMETDMQKFYLAVHSSLLRQRIADADRKAWAYVADLLTHELSAIYDRFLKVMVEETGMPRLADAFAWANMAHIRTLTHDMVRAVATCDVEMDDNVVLALRIISQKAVSADRQDEAAVRAVMLDGNEVHREEMADRIDAFEEHMREKEQAAREANESYYRQKEQQRQQARRGRQETMTTDAMAARLGERYNVTRR